MMKYTDFIILFFIITIPTFFFINMKAENTMKFAHSNTHYEQSMTSATQSAIDVLRTNVAPKNEINYNSYKINPVNPQLSFDVFLKSLAINFSVDDSVTFDLLSRYVPAYAVVDYDGLLLNVYKPTVNADGENEFGRVWLPKIPFSYKDDYGNVINFTVDDDVDVYVASLGEWYSDKRELLAADTEIDVPLLHDEDMFDKERRNSIVNTLQDHFAYYINEHNVYTKQLDMTYKFTMPLINEEDWYNTVDDVGIIAFFQGYPYQAGDERYNEFAFVGSRLQKNERILANIIDGEPRYWYESCNYPHAVKEIYSTKKEAAAKGYIELSCLNPS